MLGFLFKIIVVAGLVAVVGFGYLKNQQGSLNLGMVLDTVRTADLASLGSRINENLDSWVIQSNQSPVVLGIQITENSLETVGDTLRGLPPDQLEIIRDYICQPASPSGE